MPLTAIDARQAVTAIDAQIAETRARLNDDPSLAPRLELMLRQRANFKRFATKAGS